MNAIDISFILILAIGAIILVMLITGPKMRRKHSEKLRGSWESFTNTSALTFTYKEHGTQNFFNPEIEAATPQNLFGSYISQDRRYTTSVSLVAHGSKPLEVEIHTEFNSPLSTSFAYCALHKPSLRHTETTPTGDDAFDALFTIPAEELDAHSIVPEHDARRALIQCAELEHHRRTYVDQNSITTNLIHSDKISLDRVIEDHDIILGSLQDQLHTRSLHLHHTHEAAHHV